MAHYKGAASEAGRAMQLLKKREQAQMEIEFRKKKIEEDLKISNIENKFAAHYDAVEQQLKTSTIGLVTLDEMKAKQENIVKERERKLAQKQAEKEREQQRQLEAKQAEKNRQRKQIAGMSSVLDDDSDANETLAQESSTCHVEALQRKRKNRNRPQELSSKAPTKTRRPRPVERRDPRFDTFCGEYDEKVFKSSYKFLDEIRANEKKELMKRFKKEKNVERRNQIRYLLERTANQERARKKKDEIQDKVMEQKEKYAKGILEGKTIPFPSKSETKMIEILHDFQHLDKKGRIENYLKKKTKKMTKHQPSTF